MTIELDYWIQKFGVIWIAMEILKTLIVWKLVA